MTFAFRFLYFSLKLFLNNFLRTRGPDFSVVFQGCELLETGQGMEYQILAGPTFVVVFTLSGILMGYLADKTSR